MMRMRLFEEACAEMWAQGLISGELHLGIGEEGIVAGVTDHLLEGDAMALDHRGTPPLVARGADLVALFLECLGHPDGLGAGQGGHMHLFERDLLAASSGIVGASGPAACGFALSARHLRPGRVAVAFFGESAVNQGMLMEALNLAVVWRLPVVFVAKDNGWAITTRSARMTAGALEDRLASFAMPVERVDGAKVDAIWRQAGRSIKRARSGRGPSCLIANCHRPRGHFEDDPLLRRVSDRTVLTEDVRRMLGAAREHDRSMTSRARGLLSVTRTITAAAIESRSRRDPIRRAGRKVEGEAFIENRARAEVTKAASEALSRIGAES